MNILHLGKYYSPDRGGIESVTQTLAEGCSSLHKITVLCLSRFKHSNTKFSNKNISIFRIKFNFIFLSQPLSFSYILNAIRLAKINDLIHIHAPNFLAVFSLFFIDKKLTKIVVHWHGDVVNKGLFGFITRPFTIYLLDSADLVIVTSDNYASSSIFLKKYISKLKVIHIGISAPEQAPKDFILPKNISSFLGSSKYIISIGRLVNYKGFQFLIEAVSKFKHRDFKLLIIGDGPLMSPLTKLVNSLSLDSVVMLTGGVDDNTIRYLYQNATLYCMSSINRAEAFGVVLLEAMSFGLPCIATNIPGSGVPWVNSNNVTGLNVEVENTEGLKCAIELLLSNPDKLYIFSNAAKQRFAQEFSSEIFINRVISVYTSLFSDVNVQ